MSLSPERQTTASVAPLIVHGSRDDLYRHWQERTGQVEYMDFSEDFPVQWGKHNETFCLDWVERSTQIAIIERQRFVKHPVIPNIGATLDGVRIVGDDKVIETIEQKVLGPFQKAESHGFEIGFLHWYAPQVAVQVACRGAARGLLCVQQGNTEPALYEMLLDDAYIIAVLERLVEFQRCVDEMRAPAEPPPAPVPPEKWRTIDLDASKLPNWAHAIKPALDVWRTTKRTWDEHEQAKKDIKLLLPADVGKATYGEIAVKRNRAGAVSIAEVV